MSAMRDRLPDDSLPVQFQFDSETKQLDVIFADGEQVRYYEIDSRSAFLDPRNQRRAADFVTFVNQRDINPYKHNQYCRATCSCPYLIKREQIQEATDTLPEPETRPAVASGQNGQTTLPESPWPWPSVEKS